MRFHDETTRVFFVLGSTDMRKGINTLALEVTSHSGLNPLDNSLYVFCSRDRRKLKVLYWDRNGFCLFQKCLEKDKFQWPEQNQEFIALSVRELHWLLDGLNPVSIFGYQDLKYLSIK